MSAATNAGLSLDVVSRRRSQAFEKLAQNCSAPNLRPKPRAIQARFPTELGCERQTTTWVFLMRWRMYVETASGPNSLQGNFRDMVFHGTRPEMCSAMELSRSGMTIHTFPQEASTSKTLCKVCISRASYLLESFERRYRAPTGD